MLSVFASAITSVQKAIQPNMWEGSGYILIQHIRQPLIADPIVLAPAEPLCSAVCHAQFQATAKIKNVTSVITDFSEPLSCYFHLMISIFTSSCCLQGCHHSSLVPINKSSLSVSHFSLYSGRCWHARTSAAGIPSGGRHCSSTSCSKDTSFPRGSCSKDFFRSEGREKQFRHHLTG